VSPDYIKQQYSFLSELRNIKPDRGISEKIQEKTSFLNSFQDVKDNAIKNLADKLGETFGKISEKLDSFLGGGNKTAKVDQNISLDINATVAGSNMLASNDFKNEMALFVSSYVTRKMGEVWKTNTGKPMINSPEELTA
jgi:hypothetical protein